MYVLCFMMCVMDTNAIPTVEVYTRHSADCPQASQRSSKKCRCPKWLTWRQAGKEIRKSAKTRSWSKAQEAADSVEEQFRKAKTSEETKLPGGMTVKHAVDLYLEDKREQQSGVTLIGKLTRLLKERNPQQKKKNDESEPAKILGFTEWCATKPIPAIEDVPLPVKRIVDVTIRHLEEFRKTWPGSPLTKKKMQELLRSFFQACLAHGWVLENPAAQLSKIRVKEIPTDYFTEEEFEKIISACDTYRTKSQRPLLRRAKVKALIRLLRWSGLRAGDAIKLERTKLNGNKLLLRTEKTGTPVWCPIPPDVADQLRSVENSNPDYFFWSGNGSADSVYSDYHRTFEKVFAEANLGKRCHPHMFRDTFAVGLFLAGVPVEQVSKLLGHKSIRVTEKHYSPWVMVCQEQLEQSVEKSWVVGK